MAVLRICAPLLLFDCQEAFHCCLVVACINRINMISIECHRSGERCPGKREFDNRIEINRVRSGEIMWLFPLTFAIWLTFRLKLSQMACSNDYLINYTQSLGSIFFVILLQASLIKVHYYLFLLQI